MGAGEGRATAKNQEGKRGEAWIQATIIHLNFFKLLIETIPRLCRSKRDILFFLRGAATNHRREPRIAYGGVE